MVTDAVGSEIKGLTYSKSCRKSYIYHWNTAFDIKKDVMVWTLGCPLSHTVSEEVHMLSFFLFSE